MKILLLAVSFVLATVPAATVAIVVVPVEAHAQTRSATPPPGTVVTPAPSSPLDGQWRGRSDGGSCNAPLEYLLVIESGIVDGSAFDTTARGPVPNPNKSAPPPPGPGLWQIHGLARGNPFNLLSVASVKGRQHRNMKLTARSDGGSLVVTEADGCRRTARLVRG